MHSTTLKILIGVDKSQTSSSLCSYVGIPVFQNSSTDL